jgi:hypothetical protein
VGLGVLGYRLTPETPWLGRALGALAIIVAAWGWYSARGDWFVVGGVIGGAFMGVAAIIRSRWPGVAWGLVLCGVLAFLVYVGLLVVGFLPLVLTGGGFGY